MVAPVEAAGGLSCSDEAGESGLPQHPDRQREHDHVDGGTAEIDEPADPLHAAQEDEQLKDPHEQEAEPGRAWTGRGCCCASEAAAEGHSVTTSTWTALEAK